MGVASLGRHTRPVCNQGFTRSLKLCQECRFNSCVRVFFIPWGHVSNHAQIWAYVTSISHMGEMRDSDWSRQNLLRSDWSGPRVALITTYVIVQMACFIQFSYTSSSTKRQFWLIKDIHIIKYFPLIYYFPTQPSANSAKVGDEVELTGIFKNPLQVPLTNGHFLVQATRMKPRTIRFDCK